MALLGIQEEMASGGYFPVPGHYSNRNVNTNVSVLPLNNFDNIFENGNYYNCACLLPSPDQNLVQNKEVVKQTILKHEAIFKDQIHELHRIYWRQKELMDGVKKSELLNHHLQQGMCDYAQKTSHVLSLPGENPACNESSVSAAESDLSLSHFNDRKFAHSGPVPAQIDFSLKGCEFQSSKKFVTKILDLELPPTEYMDSEDEESLQKVPEVADHPLNRISEAVHKRPWQPYNGSGGFNSVFQDDDLNPGLVTFKKNPLADLNEPIKLEEKLGTMSIYLPDLNEPNKNEEEVAAASNFLVDLNEPIELQEEEALSSDFQIPLPGRAEFLCQDLSHKYNLGFQVSPIDDITLNTETGRDSETCSDDLHLEKYDDEAGQSRRKIASLSPRLSEEASTSLQDIDLKQADDHETYHLSNQRRKSCGEVLKSPGKDLFSNSNPLPVSSNNVGTSSELICLTDVGNSKPSSVSSSKKHICDIVQTPIIVHALPCISSTLFLRKRSNSSITGPGVAGKRACHGESLKSNSKFDNASFHQSCMCNGLSAESRTLESSPPSISSNGQDVSEELTFEQHGPTKLEGSVRGLPWLKKNLVHKRKSGKRSESSTLAETHQNPSEDEAIKNVANDNVININLDCDPVPESEEHVTSSKPVAGGGLDREVSCFGAGIDLDLFMEDDESSPKPSLSTELGLDAPVSPENKESTPPRRDSDENHVETPSELSGKENGDVQEDLAQNAAEAIVPGEKDGELQEELSWNAATALVSISSSVVITCPETAACEPSELCRSDELHWFAKVVSLVGDDPGSEFGMVLSSKNNDGYEECMFNGLDYFEAMTLNLTETKLEEANWFETNDQNGKKEEKSGVSYLPSQQRKSGRMRRARQQQKDFQSEILPSLASLSRCEVTEDIQTIEGAIQAANSQRGTVCTRSMSRNARARGRKRCYISTSNLTDITICSPSNLGEGRRLIGWGNITRRCRGPRTHATNPWLR